MIWFLLFVGVAICSAYFVWDYRRKAEAREAASKKRFEEMFMARQGPAAAAGVPPVAVPQPAVTAPPAVVGAIKAAAPVAPPVQRFLDPAETLVYRLLRASIPDHEVFANVTLASVIGAPGTGYEREQQLRKLAQYHLDFVVCEKGMRVVAVVEVESATGAAAAGDQQFKADSLKGAGIVLVRLNPKALPRREDLRTMVCGANPAPGASAGAPAKNG